MENNFSSQHDNPSLLWVSADVAADRPAGTYGDPFGSIGAALDRAREGQKIVLKNGIYRGDVTVQKSGSVDFPIAITAEHAGGALIESSCWYFYDISDMIVSDLHFLNSPHGALSIIGQCERNSFIDLVFKDCGREGKESCTLYLGGSGSNCNVVENCRFERRSGTDHVAIGIMIAEGDVGTGEPNRDCLFSKNHFSNYGYAMLIGSQDFTRGEYGHVLECNTIEGCRYDGLLIRCGDTTVRNNDIRDCGRSGVTIAAGRGSLVENNRIGNSGTGIRTLGAAHTIQNNCLVRCDSVAIHVSDKTNSEQEPSQNIIIEQNTLVDCGIGLHGLGIAGIQVDPSTSCIMRRNLFYGTGKPYQIAGSAASPTAVASPQCFIDDNISAGGCESMAGSQSRDIAFASYSSGDFSSNSGYGAQGWQTKAGPYDMDAIAGDAERIMAPNEEEEEEEEEIEDEIDENENMDEGEDLKDKGLFY
jgi:hypothetical protein